MTGSHFTWLSVHCAMDHRNFQDICRQFGLSMPDPPPECWACNLAKPRMISHDKVSTRVVTRTYEGMAADAKGPMNTPTPEGFQYFFVIVCLYSFYHWVILARSQADWKDIWEVFVKRAEASSGKERCISFLITDGHKVHVQNCMKIFNANRGIQGI